MNTRRLLWLWFMCVTVVLADESSTAAATMEEDTSEERHKSKDNSLQHMFMAFMMLKGFIQMIFGMISPILQVKGFFISLIGLLLNIAKFIYMIKRNKEHEGGWQQGGGWENDRKGVWGPMPHENLYHRYH